MSNEQPRPDFGEYATPDEQQAMLVPLDPRASSDPRAPLPQLASMESPVFVPPVPGQRTARHRADRFFAFALLAYGLVSVLTTIPRYLDFETLANQAFQVTGIPGEFSNFAQGTSMGNMAAFLLAVGFAVTAWITIRRVRRGQRAWWVPVVGSIVTNVPVMVCLMTALMNDPAMQLYATMGGA